jgi:predicted methyltransferase MtxX (methanogen marker protein 4)
MDGIDEVGLFNDAQTVIILAFVHGRFHGIKKEIRLFSSFQVDSKGKRKEVDRLLSITLFSFMTHVNEKKEKNEHEKRDETNLFCSH